MKPINECKTVEELLSSPERWTKGNHFKLTSGNQIDYCELDGDEIDRVLKEDVCAFCVEGAIIKICGSDNGVAHRMREQLRLYAPECTLYIWNDAPERTYEEVIAVVRKAGI